MPKCSSYYDHLMSAPFHLLNFTAETKHAYSLVKKGKKKKVWFYISQLPSIILEHVLLGVQYILSFTDTINYWLLLLAGQWRVKWVSCCRENRQSHILSKHNYKHNRINVDWRNKFTVTFRISINKIQGPRFERTFPRSYEFLLLKEERIFPTFETLMKVGQFLSWGLRYGMWLHNACRCWGWNM